MYNGKLECDCNIWPSIVVYYGKSHFCHETLLPQRLANYRKTVTRVWENTATNNHLKLWQENYHFLSDYQHTTKNVTYHKHESTDEDTKVKQHGVHMWNIKLSKRSCHCGKQ